VVSFHSLGHARIKAMAVAIKRREFLTAIGGAAAGPIVARTQQPDRMPRIGVIALAAGWLRKLTLE
jgi:hypothetical protein